jgi:N-glycosylase/DNA lyase
MSYLCSCRQFNLEHTLVNGQAFRWRVDGDRWWSCVLTRRDAYGNPAHILVRLRLDGEQIEWATEPPGQEEFVRDYLRLGVDVVALGQEFCECDPSVHAAVQAFPGLRVLRQDPVECLFSFLCTSAAPLHRIRKSVEGLCRSYGAPYRASDGQEYFTFPEIERLAAAEIDDMKALGLGYRARFVQATARQLLPKGGASYLLSLRDRPYAEAKASLVSLTGVGEKIADCVCLFSLDKDDAIPVDTHIRQIAERHYLTADTRSMTKGTYALIGDTIRSRFGPMAGWAQQYLFFEDLFEKRAWSVFERQWAADDTTSSSDTPSDPS